MRSFVVLLALLASGVLRAETVVEGFDWRRDSLAFSNDTVFEYGTDSDGRLTMRRKGEKVRFAHRCFTMCRATIQFHRFARFAPDQPQVSADEYRRLVRRIFRVPTWRAAYPPERRIAIPGFADLHDFSAAYDSLLRENIGYWVSTYLRIGNWRIVNPVPRSGQARLSRWLTARVDGGQLGALYLYRIPWMNHVVVVFGYERLAGGDLRFGVLDPNYPNEATSLFYRAGKKSFEFPKRWYWTGGQVNAMRVFISPFH